MITLDALRSFAVARSLFGPTTLRSALHRMGFVQADPIRAPARAQDLTLRHRVTDYRAGDLERHYIKLGVEEDFFINYGFVTREVEALMHPRLREVRKPGEQYSNPWRNARWPVAKKKRAQLLLDFINERGSVHPREVEEHFAHGTVKNYWGGSSNATTHLLDAMHYSGMLRVARRDGGIRIYAPHQHGLGPADPSERRARIDALVDVAVNIYAPVPASTLAILVRRLRYAVPQWHGELKNALTRAKERLAHAHLDGVDWFWPTGEDVTHHARNERVRLLTPFDPIVWDRNRFEMLWGWTYRFEAYTPPAKRIRGYYALPLLWRNQVIGWGNVAVKGGELTADFGFVQAAPADRAFKRQLEAELDRMRSFLRLQ
jgi:uncharacterized protein